MSTPIKDLITDSAVGFTPATLQSIRDFIESGHDHSSGGGRPIPTGGVAIDAITGAKLAASAVTSEKLDLQIIQGSDLVSDFSVPLDGVGIHDNITGTFTLDTDSVIEVFYSFNRIDPAVSTTDFTLIVKLADEFAVTLESRTFVFRPELIMGMTLRAQFDATAGIRQIRVLWVTANIGGTATVKPARWADVLVFGR